MNSGRWILGLTMTVVSFALAHGQQISNAPPIEDEVVRRTSNTWNKPFHFPVRIPEVTGSIIEYPPGSAGVRHTSPYTRYIYVIEGTLTLDLDDGRQVDFPAGSLILGGSTRLTPRNNGMVSAKVLVIDQTEVGESNSVLEK